MQISEICPLPQHYLHRIN